MHRALSNPVNGQSVHSLPVRKVKKIFNEPDRARKIINLELFHERTARPFGLLTKITNGALYRRFDLSFFFIKLFRLREDTGRVL